MNICGGSWGLVSSHRAVYTWAAPPEPGNGLPHSNLQPTWMLGGLMKWANYVGLSGFVWGLFDLLSQLSIQVPAESRTLSL